MPMQAKENPGLSETGPAGGYKNLRQLAAENFKRKQSIQERFFTEENFLRHLPLPDRLSGVIHMARGTGKSWVIFAIA